MNTMQRWSVKTLAYLIEQLAQAMVSIPLEVHGVYRSVLEPDAVYDGHVDRPTTKCAVMISLQGQADFIYNETERYRLKPGKILIGGASRSGWPFIRARKASRRKGNAEGNHHALPFLYAKALCSF